MRALPVNTIKISLASFLAYFLMSAIGSLIGIVNKEIAAYYNVPITDANAVFGYLTIGVVVGCLIAIHIFDYVKFKLLIIAAAAAICASIYAMYAIDHFDFLPLCLGIAGVGCGLQLSAAAVVITETYSEKWRPSMLLLTDSFYSLSGTFSTFLATALLAKQLHFSSVYALAFAVSVSIAMIALFSQYSINTKVDEANSQASLIRNQPASVHMISLAIFMYLLGFVCIISWVTNYAINVLAAPEDAAGRLVSRLFSGMFIGQLITFFIVMRFSARNLLVIYTIATALLTVPLWNVMTIELLQTNMFVLGLIGGGLFKVMLAYGTTIVANPSSRLVSYLIFSSAFGTAVAPAVGSFVVERSNMAGALQFATFCYSLTCLLFLASLVFGARRRVAVDLKS